MHDASSRLYRLRILVCGLNFHGDYFVLFVEVFSQIPQKPSNILSRGFNFEVQAFERFTSDIYREANRVENLRLDDELCKSENRAACIITGRE